MTVSQFALRPQPHDGNGLEHVLLGNASDERTGKIVNSANTLVQYENFTDNSRSWTSSWASYMQGPNEGLDYVYRALYSSWRLEYLALAAHSRYLDVVSFKIKGRHEATMDTLTNTSDISGWPGPIDNLLNATTLAPPLACRMSHSWSR